MSAKMDSNSLIVQRRGRGGEGKEDLASRVYILLCIYTVKRLSIIKQTITVAYKSITVFNSSSSASTELDSYNIKARRHDSSMRAITHCILIH